ncbi:ubiquitin carboxyl-terminal hydrolase 3 [Nilaparvata lugens]|uniref:ubiquitin carboxyl-terminal hydrolase 3 n=1 Tax=Nilaparvata lugens TaxID=108931 RepID=UPI00193E4A4D|nr:ubiquitin carboxyl-terminal hydrolase 3 [Nilaparvata lugens]
MECPHLINCVKLQTNNLTDKTNATKELICSDCSTDRSPWICLHCGKIHCGRYVNGHALQHSSSITCHNVCMDCESLAVFCYDCDEFVVNDVGGGLVEQARRVVAGWRGGLGAQHPPKSPPPTARTRTLRPRSRKRSHSADSGSGGSENNPTPTPPHKMANNSQSSPIKSPKKEKKVVGLRNLGNTCFMNAVLQSLSNIDEFCLYFKRLPSLDSVVRSNSKSNSNSNTTTTRAKVYHGRSSRSVSHQLSDELMAEELRKVLINLKDQSDESKTSAISPESLFLVIWKVVPRFRGYQQQDAHEFLLYMLSRVHTELLHLLPDLKNTLKDNLYVSLGHSIVTSVFGGVLQSEVRCLNCSMESKMNDPFLDLSLEIPDKYLQQRKVSSSHKDKDKDEPTPPDEPHKPPPCHIFDCLTNFTEVEEFAESELYYCNNCKGKQRSTKRFWIRRLPNVLCLHFKRFRWNHTFYTKVDTSISFPVTSLDMSKFVLSDGPVMPDRTLPADGKQSLSNNMTADMVPDGPESDGPASDRKLSDSLASDGKLTDDPEKLSDGPENVSGGSNLYDLAAVIVHHGSGAGSGHYTAFALNDGQWFHFNDSSVRPTQPDIVAKCKPYIMFYIRREFRLPVVASS